MTLFFNQLAGEEKFSGLNLILGSYAIHVIEGEVQTVNRILHGLD